MTLAITGGTGFVGQAVLEEAGRRAIPAKALTRREQPARHAVQWVHGDLANHAALAELVSGCSAVLHIAGVVNAPDAAGFHAGNVAGTQALLEAVRAQGCRRLVCVSSVAAREPGLSDYGWSKREAEDLVRASDLDWTVVRPPAVYGPRDTEMFEMFLAARFRLMPLPPRGRTSVIHADDLARLLLDLATAKADDHAGAIYEPDDGREGGWDTRDLARAIGTASGRRVFPFNLSASLLRQAARLDRRLRGDKARLTPDRARYMAHSDWVSDPAHKVPAEVWQPAIDTRDGLARTAQWYRAAGWM